MEEMSSRQKDHYERVHDAYREYYDVESMAYRERFLYDPLLSGLDLNEKDVADLASGSGATSAVILKRFPRARVTGFDISAKACAEYRETIGRPAFQVDLTKPVDVGETFDAAIIIGGIHHCVVDLSGTLRTIRRLLKPGGLLLMMEPSDDFVLASVRNLWYRLDNVFDAQTEHALSHGKLSALAEESFSVLDVTHLGGPGYFLILNSMVFRLPRFVKRAIFTPLMLVDRAYNLLPGRFWFPYFLARWRAREDSSSP